MNQDLFNKAIARAKDGKINLGCANGWDNETRETYNELYKYRKLQSSRNLGRCYNEYTFLVEIGGNTYSVVHSVDSSD